LLGILIVLLAVLLAVAVQAVVHRLLPLPLHDSDIAAISTIYAAIYVVYGVDPRFFDLSKINDLYARQILVQQPSATVLTSSVTRAQQVS
jgi:hypothetical protein